MSSIACSSSGELATKARSSAYIDRRAAVYIINWHVHQSLVVHSSSSTRRQYRKMERTSPCRTPCQQGKGLNCWLSQITEQIEVYHLLIIYQIEEVYHLLIICQFGPRISFWWSFTSRLDAIQYQKPFSHQGKQHRLFPLLMKWLDCFLEDKCSMDGNPLAPWRRHLEEGLKLGQSPAGGS